MRTCAAEWGKFRSEAIAKDAPPIQLREMELSFFAGFFACLAITVELSDLNDEAAIQVLNGLHEELYNWLEKLGRSKP